MRRLVLHWFLLRVIGRRILLGYGVVALLSVAILASLYMASRYGLEAYVADQLGRVPWEISVIQRGETYRFAELQDSYRQRAGVREVQGLGFLRVRNLSPVRLEVANQAVPIRWVVFVSVSNERFLPPELRRAFGENSSRGSSPRAIEAALVGAPGNAANDGSLRNIRAGSAVRFAVALDQEGADTHSHDRRAAAPESLRVLLEGELASNPLQIDRQEFNKWMLREVGALSYLPEEAIVFPVPLEDFQELASQFHELFLTSEGDTRRRRGAHLRSRDDPPDRRGSGEACFQLGSVRLAAATEPGGSGDLPGGTGSDTVFLGQQRSGPSAVAHECDRAAD